MKWSPEAWEKSVESLVDQCAEKVLRELEESITARFREAGETIIQGLLKASDNLLYSKTERNDFSEVKENEVDEEVFYAFCIFKVQSEPITLLGMEDRTCLLLENGSLGMLVCPVSGNDYNEESLHCHMEDMAWVVSHARRHEEVLLKVMEDRAIIPLPFCTIYTNENNIRQQLTKNAAMIHDDLRRLETHYEMQLKLFVNRQRLFEKLQEEIPFTGGQNGGGYFQKLQREKKLNAETERVMDDFGESLYQDLKLLAEEGILIEKSEVLVQEEQSLVFAVHYLISKECREKWENKLKEFDEKADPLGFMVEVSGPWPPYHFSRLKNEEEKTCG
jgi:hypothetical protein